MTLLLNLLHLSAFNHSFSPISDSVLLPYFGIFAPVTASALAKLFARLARLQIRLLLYLALPLHRESLASQVRLAVPPCSSCLTLTALLTASRYCFSLPAPAL